MTDTDMQALEEALKDLLQVHAYSVSNGHNTDAHYRADLEAIRDLFKQSIPIAKVREMLEKAEQAGINGYTYDVPKTVLKDHGYEVGDDDG